MKVLFDQGTPFPLCHELAAHTVSTTYELGWSTLTNGELLEAAEGRFDLLITTDQNLRYQQDLAGGQLAILVLPTTSWPVIRDHANDVASAITTMKAGEYRELEFSD